MSAPDTPQPTKRAAAFMAANAVSPVVDGDASASGGIRYTLQDGTDYVLDRADVASLPIRARWLHDVR